MPSFNIHLAIGKRYLEKNPTTIKDVEEFNKGIIAPDLTDNKQRTHYTGERDANNLEKYLKAKVQIHKYCQENILDTDYQKGIFLHLIADYLFFTEFFDKQYIRNISHEDFTKDLYYSYDLINQYLEKKYNLNYMNLEETIKKKITSVKKEKNVTDEGIRSNILPIQKLEELIEYVSDINLEDYRIKILTNNKETIEKLIT